MNITLREVYQTSPDGDRFWKLKECYIRGSTVRSTSLKIYCGAYLMDIVSLFFFIVQIKYLRVPDNLLDVVKEEQNRARDANRNSRGGHSGGGEETNTHQKSNLTNAILPFKVVVLREEASL